MRRFMGLGIALAFAPLPALADQVSTFKLDNGMEIVVIEDHRAPVVVHMVWYKIGAADEVAGHSGVAHFLEHLMFQGTDDVAANEFSALVEAQGGNDNAFTTLDYTAYYQRVAADRLDLMMKLEADRMRDLRLTEEDVTTERQVILEERSQRTDSNPGALLSEQMSAAQFMNSPYGRPVIGWRHEMEALTRQNALDFYQANYAPNNAVLVVAGDVLPDAVLALAKTYYGSLAPSDQIKPRIRAQEPPQLAERRITFADERVSDPYVIRTYLAPSRNTRDRRKAAALVLLAQLLGGNPTTSVLAKALQFDTQVAVFTQAFYDGGAIDDDTFGFVVMPTPDTSLADAEKALDDVIAKFMTDGVDPGDFARIKSQVRASDIYSRDDTEGLARQYGQALTVGLTVDDVKSWPALLQDITADEVIAAATEVLNRDHAVTGWLTTKEGAAQ